MLYVFGFKRLGVVLSDLYFMDPNPGPGQEGPERGVRLEVRFLDQPGREGSVYASRPIVVDRPVWRADLLESVDNPGSLDRAHHHPSMRGWEPGRRQFDAELSADPLDWVAERLSDLAGLVDSAGIDRDEVDTEDFDQLRRAVPEILEAVRRLLARIAAGELAVAPTDANAGTLVRAGWL
jgi:hypothetical protein